jgi:anti-sigma regulatory factor (Ser/Thr protein kinase)
VKAVSAELRAENDRIPGADGRVSGDRVEAPEAAVARLPLDVRAPGAARLVVRACLRDRVGSEVLAIAELLISELVTNSVRHSGVPAGAELVVRLRVWHDRVRIEVEDPGHDGAIAPRPRDPIEAGGMGLNLVQALSERWGLVRAADGPTQVWAQVKCRAAPEP